MGLPAALEASSATAGERGSSKRNIINTASVRFKRLTSAIYYTVSYNQTTPYGISCQLEMQYIIVKYENECMDIVDML
jgi:hypothetical protein